MQREFDESTPMPEMYEPPPHKKNNYQPQNNQGNRNNQQQNNGKQQQNNPPQRPSQANPNDQLYKLVGVFRRFADEYYYVPVEVYYIQGRGVVDGSLGFRSDQVVGYAFFEGNGSLRYLKYGSTEYDYVNSRVVEFCDGLSTLVDIVLPDYERIAKLPEFNKLLKKSQKVSKKIIKPLDPVRPLLSWQWRVTLIAFAFVAFLVLLFLLNR